jgi:hypothetical protein
LSRHWNADNDLLTSSSTFARAEICFFDRPISTWDAQRRILGFFTRLVDAVQQLYTPVSERDHNRERSGAISSILVSRPTSTFVAILSTQLSQRQECSITGPIVSGRNIVLNNFKPERLACDALQLPLNRKRPDSTPSCWFVYLRWKDKNLVRHTPLCLSLLSSSRRSGLTLAVRYAEN